MIDYDGMAAHFGSLRRSTEDGGAVRRNQISKRTKWINKHILYIHALVTCESMGAMALIWARYAVNSLLENNLNLLNEK
jgi:hypothetical protein